MVPTPKMEYQVFLCIFRKNFAMATSGLKEMGKFLQTRPPVYLHWFFEISIRTEKKNQLVYTEFFFSSH